MHDFGSCIPLAPGSTIRYLPTRAEAARYAGARPLRAACMLTTTTSPASPADSFASPAMRCCGGGSRSSCCYPLLAISNPTLPPPRWDEPLWGRWDERPSEGGDDVPDEAQVMIWALLLTMVGMIAVCAGAIVIVLVTK